MKVSVQDAPVADLVLIQRNSLHERAPSVSAEKHQIQRGSQAVTGGTVSVSVRSNSKRLKIEALEGYWVWRAGHGTIRARVTGTPACLNYIYAGYPLVGWILHAKYINKT
jgi:hypothetical protein